MMVWETWRLILRELGPSPNGVCEARHANPPDVQEPGISQAGSCQTQAGSAAKGISSRSILYMLRNSIRATTNRPIFFPRRLATRSYVGRYRASDRAHTEPSIK